MLKIAHLADIHAREKDFDEIKDCLFFIHDTIKSEGVDLIIVAGDVLDNPDIKLDSRIARLLFFVFKRFVQVAPVLIVKGTPSHEGDASAVLSFIQNNVTNVYYSDVPELLLLNGNEIISYDPNINFLQTKAILSTMPTPAKQYYESELGIEQSDKDVSAKVSDVLSGFAAIIPYENLDGLPHILTGHFQITGAHISESQIIIGRDIELSRDQVELAQADLVCLGHIHKAQRIGDNIYYSGSIYSTDYGETDEKGFYIHTIDQGTVLSVFHPTPAKKLVSMTLDFTHENESTIADIEIMILANAETRNVHLKLTIKVYRDDAPLIDKESIERFCLDTGAAKDVNINIIQIPRENIRSKNFMKLNTMADKVKEQARIKNEDVPATALSKLEMLETMTAEQVIEQVSNV